VVNLIRSFHVTPLYGQVTIECEGATELPIPETGSEPIVSSPDSLLVATRGDDEGDVLIEIFREASAPAFGTQIFDGELLLTSPRLVIGNALAGQSELIEVDRIGLISIRVNVDLPGKASVVNVVIPDGDK
jgi:hypothetical protein